MWLTIYSVIALVVFLFFYYLMSIFPNNQFKPLDWKTTVFLLLGSIFWPISVILVIIWII